MPGTKNVYVDGVFDFFHEGHINFLKSASSHGNLIVGVHSDEFARSYKRQPYIREETRYKVVEACRYVSRIIPGAGLLTDEIITENKIDLVLHGDDLPWKGVYKYYKCAISKGIFSYIAYTSSVSTSWIISEIEERFRKLA